jgi:hypothetical protein
MKAFFRVVINGRPQRLEIAPRAPLIATMSDVRCAGLGIDL